MRMFLILLVVLLVLGLVLRWRLHQRQAKQNHAKGALYLAENAKHTDVVTTSSGLQYQILKRGQSGVRPTLQSKVEVHYSGHLIDGTVFDSSIARGTPITFGVTQVIAGWTEALQLMQVGDEFRIVIPSALGYGDRKVGKIPPGSVLVFTVQLLAVHG